MLILHGLCASHDEFSTLTMNVDTEISTVVPFVRDSTVIYESIPTPRQVYVQRPSPGRNMIGRCPSD